jgi:flavin reductase (DIM6/NTAB) family NADH-FMN oxidoreductase RutF
MTDDPIASIFDEGKREIFLIATSDDSRPSGMIITWVTSASLIPDDKRIVLVLSPHNHTTQVLLRRRRFILHLLAHDQAALVPTFGLYSSRDVDKFASVLFTLDDDSGIPIVEGTCGWARGNLISQMDTGERFIVLAQIEKEVAYLPKRSLLVRDLAQQLSGTTLQEMQDKLFRDVERDRRIRAQTS